MDDLFVTAFEEAKEHYLLGNAFGYLIKEGGTPEVSYSLAGKLYISKSGWLLVSVPNNVIRGLFDALREPGAELPMNSDGVLNGHISIMDAKEVESIGGPDKISERGHDVHYSLGGLKTVVPSGDDKLSRVWYVTINSPEIRQLRKSYGLEPYRKGYDHHVTIAVRKKNVLGNNEVSKAAAVLPPVGPPKTTKKIPVTNPESVHMLLEGILAKKRYRNSMDGRFAGPTGGIKVSESIFDEVELENKKRKEEQMRTLRAAVNRNVSVNSPSAIDPGQADLQNYVSELKDTGVDMIVDPKRTWKKKWPWILAGVGAPILAGGMYLKSTIDEEERQKAAAAPIELPSWQELTLSDHNVASNTSEHTLNASLAALELIDQRSALLSKSGEEAMPATVSPHEQETPYSCGASAFKSVVEASREAKPESHYREALETDETGTNPTKIQEECAKFDFNHEAKQGMTVDDLKAYVDAGKPVICLIQMVGEPAHDDTNGHYVVVIDVQGDNVVFHDPATGKEDRVSKADFEARWHDTRSDGKEYNRYGVAVWEGQS